MIAVAGFWNFGWTVPLQEYHLWDMVRRDFKVDKLIMCPITGINKNIVEYDNFGLVKENNLDLTHVFIDESGEILLEDFEHPKDCLYIFGKTSYSVYKSEGSKGLSVKIKTPANNAMLEPHQALAIILYDRMMKQ